MAWSAKCRLYLIFSTGAKSCVGSVERQMAQTSMNLDSNLYVILIPVERACCFVLGSYTGVLAWTMVDLGHGLVTASLPVIVGLIIPRASSSGSDAFDHSASPTTKTGAYLRALTRNHTTSGRASQGKTSITGLISLDPET